MPAEYRHATSGALIVVKKAGTNTLHGQGGELIKSTSMMHRRFFQLQTLQQQSKDNSTLFQMPDFVVSGPVRIPKIYNCKNRTFFEVAGSYHVDSSSNASAYAVPATDMLAGNFSAFSNQLYDPLPTSGTFAAASLSRVPFAGNLIPASRFSTCGRQSPATTVPPQLEMEKSVLP